MTFFTDRFQTIADFFNGQRFPIGDWKNLFSWSFWTESYLASGSAYFAFTFVATIILCAGLLIWRARLKKLNQAAPVYDGPIAHLASLVAFIAVIMLTYWFARSQQIATISSRLVLLAAFIVVAGWLGYVAYQLWRVIPAKRQAHLEKERFFRYLPKKRK